MRLRPVEVDAAKVERQAESLSAVRCEQALERLHIVRVDRVPGLVLTCRGVIVGRRRKNHPRLTRRARPGEARAMAFRYARRPSARDGNKERRGGLLRLVLEVAADRVGDPQPDLRALQHPVGIDAADPVHRRLSVRCEMALRLLALQLPVGASRRSTAASSASLPERGDVVVFRVSRQPTRTS